MAPRSLEAQFLFQIRSGVTVASFIWFLYLYKRNAFTRIISGKSLTQEDRERYRIIDRLSSIVLLVLGSMAFAESCGVGVQSVITVGGIGGIYTQNYCRDSIRPISIQFKPSVFTHSRSVVSEHKRSNVNCSQWHSDHTIILMLWQLSGNLGIFLLFLSSLDTGLDPIRETTSYVLILMQEWPLHSRHETYWEIC